MLGSSPLMRGKVKRNNRLSTFSRIIPAHAGKSDSFNADYDSGRDHPRSCGEKYLTMIRPNARIGSSPLMRGKGSSFLVSIASLGIIPAHAGKRRSVSRPCSNALGSSPLMRGKDLNKSQKPDIFAEHFTFPSAFGTQNGSACNQPTPDVSPPYPIGNIPLSFPVCNLRSL